MSSCNVRPGSLKRLNPIDRYKKWLHKSQLVPLARLSSLLKRVSRVIIRKIIFRLSMDRVGIVGSSLFSERKTVCSQINFHRRLFSARAKPSFTLRISSELRRTGFCDFARQQPTFPFRSCRVKNTRWKEKFEIYREGMGGVY